MADDSRSAKSPSLGAKGFKDILSNWEGIIPYPNWLKAYVNMSGSAIERSLERQRRATQENGEIFCEFNQYSVNIWYIRSSYGVPILTLSLSSDYPPIMVR